MNTSFYEILDRTKAFFYETLQKIESSPFYERLLEKFESLEPTHQKNLVLASRVLVLLAAGYFFVSPLFTLWAEKNALDDQRSLLAEVKAFNTALETRPRPAPNPADWKNMSAATPDEALQNLISYMNSIGLPEGSYQTLPSSGGQLQIDIPQINLRQVQTLLYQIDGWHPDLESEILTIKTLVSEPQKLSLTLTLNHKSGQAFPSTPTGARGNRRKAQGPQGGGAAGNVVQPDDEIESLAQPPSYDGASLNPDPGASRPPSPTYEEFQDPGDSLPDFEAIDAAGSMDSLPPPPPLEDEDF